MRSSGEVARSSVSHPSIDHTRQDFFHVIPASGCEIRRIANENRLTIVCAPFPRARRPIRDGQVIFVPGALGALGRVVTDLALARGARVASVDHAPTQAPATSNQLELGGGGLNEAGGG